MFLNITYFILYIFNKINHLNNLKIFKINIIYKFNQIISNFFDKNVEKPGFNLLLLIILNFVAIYNINMLIQIFKLIINILYYIFIFLKLFFKIFNIIK